LAGEAELPSGSGMAVKNRTRMQFPKFGKRDEFVRFMTGVFSFDATPTSPDRSSKQAVSTHQVSRLVTGRDQSGMTPVTTPSSFFLPQNIITD